MPVCTYSNSDGSLVAFPNDELETCQGYIMLTHEDYNYLMKYTRLDAADISSSFAFGFFAVLLTSWGLTYGVKVAQKLIKLL